MKLNQKLPLDQPYLKYIEPSGLLSVAFSERTEPPYGRPPEGEPPLFFFPQVVVTARESVLKGDVNAKNAMRADITVWDDKMMQAEHDLFDGPDPSPFPDNLCVSFRRLWQGSPAPTSAGRNDKQQHWLS